MPPTAASLEAQLKCTDLKVYLVSCARELNRVGALSPLGSSSLSLVFQAGLAPRNPMSILNHPSSLPRHDLLLYNQRLSIEEDSSEGD